MRTLRRTHVLLSAACAVLIPMAAGCGSSLSDYFARPKPAAYELDPQGMTFRTPPPAQAIPRARRSYYVPGEHAWRYIVIHHSATPAGNAQVFDRAHRNRGWDGLGYHFVITNGDGGPDGLVQVGPRWYAQKVGAHTGGTPGNEYNRHGIGICLVGDFTRTRPTPAQLRAMDDLVSDLALRYHIGPENIIGHRDAPRATPECPGVMLESYVRTTLAPRAGYRLAWRR